MPAWQMQLPRWLFDPLPTGPLHSWVHPWLHLRPAWMKTDGMPSCGGKLRAGLQAETLHGFSNTNAMYFECLTTWAWAGAEIVQSCQSAAEKER